MLESPAAAGPSLRPFTDVSAVFPVVPESASAARRYVAAAFRRFGPDGAPADAAVQLASEIVAWGYRHGIAPLRLAVTAPDPSTFTVRMSVHHEGSVPEMEPSLVRLLDHIASEWTAQADPERTTVRFVIRSERDGGPPGAPSPHRHETTFPPSRASARRGRAMRPDAPFRTTGHRE